MELYLIEWPSSSDPYGGLVLIDAASADDALVIWRQTVCRDPHQPPHRVRAVQRVSVIPFIPSSKKE